MIYSFNFFFIHVSFRVLWENVHFGFGYFLCLNPLDTAPSSVTKSDSGSYHVAITSIPGFPSKEPELCAITPYTPHSLPLLLHPLYIFSCICVIITLVKIMFWPYWRAVGRLLLQGTLSYSISYLTPSLYSP